ADVNSDHNLLCSNNEIRLKKLRNYTPESLYHFEDLKDVTVRERVIMFPNLGLEQTTRYFESMGIEDLWKLLDTT
ncbi:hypothetical protein HHI36_015594, partial [Cryptolaemus montrouzieri]